MTCNTKTGPAGAATDSAPDAPPDGQPGPSAAAPPGGPAAAIVAALTAAPGATAAQLAQAAGTTRAAAARELAALEKAAHATRDRTASPATWTARDVPDEAPRPGSPDSLALPPSSSIGAAGIAAQDAQGQDAGDLGPEKDAGSAAPAGLAGMAPGADEALGAASVAAAQAEAALQAGDLAGALAAADHLTQAAARTRRLLRQAGHAARRGPAAGTPLSDRAGYRAEFTAGVRFFVTSRSLLAMSASVMIATLGMGALNALEVFFLRDNLHVTPAWLGACWAVVGAGAIAGALLGGRASSRIGPARVFRGSMITGGLLLLAYAGLTRIGPALAILAAAGCAFGALSAAAPPIFLTLIPPDMTGRVMSVFTPLQQAANISSIALAGLLAGTVLHNFHARVPGITLGPVNTIFAASALLIIAAGLTMIRPTSAASRR